MKNYKVFYKDKVFISDERNLLKIFQKEKVKISAPCGGKGLCGKCKVKIEKGNVSPLTEVEKSFLREYEIKNNVRLACQVFIEDEVYVAPLEDERNINILTNFLLEAYYPINPEVKVKAFKLEKPDLTNQTSYHDRLLSYFDNKYKIANIFLIRKIPDYFKNNNFLGNVIVYKDEIIDIREESFNDPLGLAIDLGTTTIVMKILSLSNGREIWNTSFRNPLNVFGADVISLIGYTMENERGIDTLNYTLVSEIKERLKNFQRLSDIYEIALSGNPTMTHIFIGVNPESISFSPYIPVFTSSLTFDALSLNFHNINPFSKIYTFPLISGYVGGDILAGILAIQLWREDGNVIFIDMGTNGEIVLKSGDIIYSCATACGPAFEGGNISMGMNAEEGAIDHVWVDEGKLRFSTIGESRERGMCGTGLIDVVAKGLELGLIDNTGKIKGGEIELGNVKILQKDIREFQLAKSAIRSGIEILLREAGIKVEDVDKIFLAGAFGSFINIENTIKVGLIPKIERRKVIPVGNSSLKGAELVLLNKHYKKIAELLSKRVKYTELSSRKDFQDLFVEFMYF
ncbi:MAG: 2Fe-2S ferredoxin [Dictyoglomus sp. NZ13-RE01]|nr:MAG: 2Fe-2S ferredoxin [Dictyoglomus sp. NZ13-RE01]